MQLVVATKMCDSALRWSRGLLGLRSFQNIRASYCILFSGPLRKRQTRCVEGACCLWRVPMILVMMDICQRWSRHLPLTFVNVGHVNSLFSLIPLSLKYSCSEIHQCHCNSYEKTWSISKDKNRSSMTSLLVCFLSVFAFSYVIFLCISIGNSGPSPHILGMVAVCFRWKDHR